MYKRSVSLIGFLAGTPGAYCSGQNEVVSTFKPPKQAHKHLSHRVPTRPVPGLVFGENSPSRIIHEAPRPRRARARARPSLEQHGRRKLGDAIDLLGLQELLRGLS